MPKITLSAKKRALEFPNSTLQSKNGKLWCNCCNEELDYTRKSVVERHLNSSKHRKNEGMHKAALIDQPKLEVTGKDARWQKMVTSFVSAGVPVHVLIIQPFFGQTLPSYQTLRRSLEATGSNEIEDAILYLRDKPVVVMADESIDIKNRKILNVLAKPMEPNCNFRLISSKIILQCNAMEVALQVDSAINAHFVKKTNVLCFISDSTPYMILAGQKLKALCERYYFRPEHWLHCSNSQIALFSNRMTHSTCWAHILHLVSEELRMKFDSLDKFISSMKACLVKSPDRRGKLLNVLKEHGRAMALPPVPVITRWTTWVMAADYYWQNFDAVRQFISCSATDSAAMTRLKQMTDDDSLAQELERLSKVSQGLKSSILHLQNDNAPASGVWLNIRATEELLKCCGLESSKLQLHFGNKHPALQYWRDVQVLDPRKAKTYFDEQPNSIPESLHSFLSREVPLDEIIKYKVLSQEMALSAPGPFEFWQCHVKEMPHLSKLAMTALCVPASSASVERSFSQLKRTFTALRTNLSDDNLEIHLKIAFNKPSLAQDAVVSDSEYESD